MIPSGQVPPKYPLEIHRFHNARIVVEKLDQHLDPDTFCPANQILIRLSVLTEAQHDGRAWSKDAVKSSENELIFQLVEKLRELSRELVERSGPFNCHL